MFERSVFLLVEDNDNDVFFVRRAFSKANVPNPLVVLKNCQDAMAYFLGIGPYANRSEYPLPSLVLLDLHLPGMSGIEFLKWLRQQSAFGQTRVVVLTSSEALRDLNDAYHAGANSCLVKLTDFDAFVRLSSALAGYWLWADKPPETHSHHQIPHERN